MAATTRADSNKHAYAYDKRGRMWISVMYFGPTVAENGFYWAAWNQGGYDLARKPGGLPKVRRVSPGSIRPFRINK